MVNWKRKASAASQDARNQACLGGCQAGAALRGGELVGRHIVLLGSDQHLTNAQVVDWAARKVLVIDGLVTASVFHLPFTCRHCRVRQSDRAAVVSLE